MAEEKGILRGMFSDGPKACAHFNEGLSKGEEKRGEFSLKRKVESRTSEERQKERQQEATCITMEAVDRLIDEAREEAAKAQGSSLGPTPEDSHQHESFNSDTFEGSVQETENGSQWFHQKIQGLFERHGRRKANHGRRKRMFSWWTKRHVFRFRTKSLCPFQWRAEQRGREKRRVFT